MESTLKACLCLWLVCSLKFLFQHFCLWSLVLLMTYCNCFFCVLGQIMNKDSSDAKLVFYDLKGGVKVIADAWYIMLPRSVASLWLLSLMFH